MAASQAGGDDFYRPIVDGEEGVPQSPLGRRSSRLLRAASQQLTAGAAVLPPPAPEEEPGGRSRLRRAASRREMGVVQQRMIQELLNRFRIRIILLGVFVGIYAFSMFCLLLWALWAWVLYSDLPCDQPLSIYQPLTIMMGQLHSNIMKAIQRRPWAQNIRATIAINIAGSIPGVVVIFYGAHMVSACKTCQETNPNLYYSTKWFISGQILCFLLTTLLFSVGFPAVLSFLTALKDHLQPGCEKVIHELPKVSAGSPELVDEEDGSVLECPICADAFDNGGTVVRTPCHHHFHEECLSKWCKNHLDCPLCRARLGNPADVGAAGAAAAPAALEGVAVAV